MCYKHYTRQHNCQRNEERKCLDLVVFPVLSEGNYVIILYTMGVKGGWGL